MLKAGYIFLGLLLSATIFADDYVGSTRCASCHENQYQLWQGSHHDWAMKPATTESVLGDFNDAVFDHYGDSTRFSKSDAGFFVTTANAEGHQETFKVAYTFGFYPLQQYLLPTEDGKLQALSVSWDSRPKSEGGQRWFHLYPDEAIPAGDTLHWTGPYQNWNNRCADCHSTNLERGFDAANQSYKTTWSEVNVACEACHGPGQKHVQWADAKVPEEALVNAGFDRGFGVVGQWLRDGGEATASLVNPGATNPAQLDVCGSCHARRSLIDNPSQPGEFHQRHALSLLQEPLYYGDGQIRDEVYVLGSFAQSKMHERGVVCSNCHEPHSLKLRAEGNAVCAQCHNPQEFDVATHHHHSDGSSGAQCVSCHMPETTYMVVDPRRDHSLRIPRPDLSEQFGVPNACNQCHVGETAAWANNATQQWLKGTGKQLSSHYTDQLLLGLQGDADSVQQLLKLAMTASAPDILQASALNGLGGLSDQSQLLVAQTQLSHTSPMVRSAAVQLLNSLPQESRLRELMPLMADPSKQVRMAVASALASVDPSLMASSDVTRSWPALLAEYETSLLLEQDTPAGQVSLGLFYAARGEPQNALKYYRQALAQAPELLVATLNLADLHRELNQEQDAVAVLNHGLQLNPEAAALHHALGLSLVRQKHYTQARPELARAAELAQDNVRYGYIHGVILHNQGALHDAQLEWQRVLRLDAKNRELLIALLGVTREREDWPNALRFAKALQALTPDDRSLSSLIAYLQQRVSRVE